jgi:hypothetical protein
MGCFQEESTAVVESSAAVNVMMVGTMNACEKIYKG